MELCRLNLQHLDLGQKLVRVELGKGNKDRHIPIGERAVTWLKSYLQTARPQLKPVVGEAAVFLNACGRRLTEQNLSNLMRRILRTSGLAKRGGCHLFRHAFATGLLRNGCGLRDIQLMLGHASLETTQLYTHVSIGQLQRAHRRFHPASRLAVATDAGLRRQLQAELKSLSGEQLLQVLAFVSRIKNADQGGVPVPESQLPPG